MRYKYLIDTNIWIFLLHGDKNIARNLIKAGKDACCLSVITAYELMYGAYNSSRKDEEVAKVKKVLKQYDVIPLPDAEAYAQSKVSLQKRGAMIDDFDLMIAATAIANGMTVVTDNTKHFNRFDQLPVENWKTH